MYKVTGKVLVKETSVGIPNLLVVLYDLDDPTIFQQEGNKQGEFFLNPETSAGGDFWQNFPGNRLGSILTNERGEFELDYEDSDFLARDRQPRPDLTLFVLAPEEMQGNRIPPLQRLLHFSYDYRFNSGRQESYIIWLSQEQLDRFQIPRPSSATRVSFQTVESVTTSLNRSFEFEKGIQAALRQQTQERLKPALESKKKADQAFQNFTLSTIPPEIRASDTYFSPGEKIFDKLIKLFDTRLAELPTLDMGAKRKLVLHLTEDQLEAWGLTVSNGIVNGEVSISDVVEYIRDTTGGGTLEYSRPVLENCLKEKEAERLFEEALAKCRANPNHASDKPAHDPEVSETSELTTISLLRDQITRQMKHTTSPEGELKYRLCIAMEKFWSIRKLVLPEVHKATGS